MDSGIKRLVHANASVLAMTVLADSPKFGETIQFVDAVAEGHSYSKALEPLA